MHVEWVDDEAVVLDTETRQLHYLNGPAALVYGLIQELGFEDGVAQLKERVGDVPNLDQQVDELVGDMVEKGLLIADG
jgi:hypothetical protein